MCSDHNEVDMHVHYTVSESWKRKDNVKRIKLACGKELIGHGMKNTRWYNEHVKYTEYLNLVTCSECINALANEEIA